MADKLLLPGFGGSDTDAFSESATTADSDTWDLSRCRRFTIQQEFTTGTPTGTFQPQMTFDGSNWASYQGAITVGDGTITSYDAQTDGAFGRLRIDPASIGGTTVSLTLKITGFSEKHD